VKAFIAGVGMTKSGLVDVALAVGFEQMSKSAMATSGNVPVTTIDRHLDAVAVKNHEHSTLAHNLGLGGACVVTLYAH
jgi:acetyl-CoA acetyltransferase